jgi:hypothetical protein
MQRRNLMNIFTLFSSGVDLKYSNSKTPRGDVKSAPRKKESVDDYGQEQSGMQMLQKSPLKRAVTSQGQMPEKTERSPSPKNETVNVYSVKIPVDLASGEVITCFQSNYFTC